MDKFFAENGFDTINILHNNHYSYEGYGICGTRGWISDNGEPADQKVLAREAGRLALSIESAQKLESSLNKVMNSPNPLSSIL